MVFTISYFQCQAGCKDTGAAFSGQSDYQKIDVFKSYEFGKMVALDGEIVFSDTDEFIYDEMVTHVPMAVHPNAKRYL